MHRGPDHPPRHDIDSIPLDAIRWDTIDAMAEDERLEAPHRARRRSNRSASASQAARPHSLQRSGGALGECFDEAVSPWKKRVICRLICFSPSAGRYQRSFAARVAPIGSFTKRPKCVSENVK
jgi:hypothetical protein